MFPSSPGNLNILGKLGVFFVSLFVEDIRQVSICDGKQSSDKPMEATCDICPSCVLIPLPEIIDLDFCVLSYNYLLWFTGWLSQSVIACWCNNKGSLKKVILLSKECLVQQGQDNFMQYYLMLLNGIVCKVLY